MYIRVTLVYLNIKCLNVMSWYFLYADFITCISFVNTCTPDVSADRAPTNFMYLCYLNIEVPLSQKSQPH